MLNNKSYIWKIIILFVFIVASGLTILWIINSNLRNNFIGRSTLTLPSNSLKFTQPKPPYYLVLSGEIDKRSDVKVEPFFFVTDNNYLFNSDQVTSNAEFNLTLKNNGTTIHESAFDANTCIDWSPGDYCDESVHDYGNFVHTVSGLSELPDEIIFSHQGKEIYTLNKPNNSFPTHYLTLQEYSKGVIKLLWESEGNNKSLNYIAYVSNNDFQSTDPSGTGRTISLAENNQNSDGSVIFTKNSFRFLPFGYVDGEIEVDLYVTDGFNTFVVRADKLKN